MFDGGGWGVGLAAVGVGPRPPDPDRPDPPAGVTRRPPRLGEMLPPATRTASEKAAELARLVGVEAEIAAYRAELVASLAADRPAWADRQPGQPGAASLAWVEPGRVPEVSEFFADELAATLCCSRTAATVLVEQCLTLVHALPATWAALADGQLDWARARGLAQVLTEPARHCAPGVVAAVEAAVLPTAMATGVRALQDAARRELTRLDAEAADRRRAAAERAAQVRVVPVADGMAQLTADLPQPVAAACLAAVDGYARMLSADGDTRPIGQLRTGVLADLVLRPWDTTRPAVTAHLTVLAPLPALTAAGPTPPSEAPQAEHVGEAPQAGQAGQVGEAAQAGAVGRAGAVGEAGQARTVGEARRVGAARRVGQVGEVGGQPVTAAHLRQVLRQLDALCPDGLQAPSGGSLTIALTDPDTGRLAATLTRQELARLAARGCPTHRPADHRRRRRGATDPPPGTSLPCACPVAAAPPPVDRYTPTPAQRRHVTTRDRTCRHPGCRNPARWTDLDHAHPYAEGGTTTCTNLCCLCRRHHRLKTHAAGWRFTLDPDGTLHVTTPGGITRITRPPGLTPARPPEHDPPPF